MRAVFVRFLARSLPHLAVLALMLVTLAPQSTAFWQCEGRMCGESAWVCCCQAPTDLGDCDAAGNHFTKGDHASEVGACTVDCHCTVGVRDGGQTIHSAPHFFAPPVFVVTPVRFAVKPQPALTVETRVSAPSRGPPHSSVYLASAFLRGPPLA